MNETRVYLDYNATAPLAGEAAEAMAAALALVGNPSSVHAEGRAARALIEEARERLARVLGAEGAQIVFTGGGTEANDLALCGVIAPNAISRLLVSAIEHASVLEAARRAGVPVETIPVDGDGLVDLTELEAMLGRDGPRALVSVMLANNETGAIQPLGEVARIAREAGALIHVDACQAAGKIPVDFDRLGADMMSLSAHKFGGPKGAGALVVRDGVALEARIAGGGQERGLRAGTENMAAIAGMARAAEVAAEKLDGFAALGALRDRLEAAVLDMAPGARVFAREAPRLANTSCFALPGMGSEKLVIALDLEGFAVSAGSACSSGKVARSHVLEAMGAGPELSGAAIRASLGPATTDREIDRFIAALGAILARANRKAPAAA